MGTSVVTGAFGFSGKYITRRLIGAGRRVVTLTGHPDRPNEFGDAVEARRLAFDDPDELRENLSGADVLFNTYWIRLEYGGATFPGAVENSRRLIRAAKDACVRRFIHISIVNPSVDSPYAYFRGKALVEQEIAESGLSYAILRPAVIFGTEGVLINNLAWFLRRMPVFVVPGSGRYRLRPIFVDDLAALAVEQAERSGNATIDAVGPEDLAFNDLLALIRRTVHSRSLIMHLPPSLAVPAAGILGRLLRDVVLTPDEVGSLTANLLTSDAPPSGQTRLSEWLAANAETVGRAYISDLRRRA